MVLQNLGYTALLLGVLVFVHEFGHFIVAKALHVKVLRFSIGFGPKIIGFTRGETEYRIAWIPLGGYVKMAGELPFEELSPQDAKRGFLAQSPWKRILIVVAGPAFNLLFPILVYFSIFYLGLSDTLSTRVGSVEPGMPAAEAGLQPGDRIVQVDGTPVRNFDELREVLKTRFDRQIDIVVDREGRTLSTRMTPAKSVDTNVIETTQRGMIGISPRPNPPVVGVPPGSPAEQAGLRTFDRILSVNGQPTRDEASLHRVLRGAQSPLHVVVARSKTVDWPGFSGQVADIAEATLEKQPGEGYAALGAEAADTYVGSVAPHSVGEKAGIKPGDKLLQLNGRPLQSFTAFRNALQQIDDHPFTLSWLSKGQPRTQELRQAQVESRDEFDQKIEALGTGLQRGFDALPELFDVEQVRLHPAFVEALEMSLRKVAEVIRMTAIMIGMIVSAKVPLSTMGGPPMLYEIAKKSAAEGLDSYLHAMAVISVNLGLINLLPIPILDGFQLVASIWEGIRRRPIPMRAREVANMIGLTMLFILMVIVISNDLRR